MRPMMDTSPPLLVLRLGSSFRLALMLGLAHVSAISLLWPLMLPVAAKLASTAALVISLVIYLRHYALRNSPGSITSLALGDDMTCTLQTRRGERIACALLGSSFVAPYLTVLELKPLNDTKWSYRLRRRSVVILPDAIAEEDFRRLRVLLRWKWKEQN
jgi:toxin CptA